MTAGQLLARLIQALDECEPGCLRGPLLVLHRQEVGDLAAYLAALERQVRQAEPQPLRLSKGF